MAETVSAVNVLRLAKARSCCVILPGRAAGYRRPRVHAGPNYVTSFRCSAKSGLPLADAFTSWSRPIPNLDLFSAVIVRARFHARSVAERSIFIESLVIYELEAL